MRRLKRAALISALADKLRQRGSWTGETHVQKAIYFLQDMLGVPIGHEYVLYKHGPFSFDLRDDLSEMRADHIVQVVPSSPPYGPRLFPGEAAEQLRAQFPQTLSRYETQLEFVADHLRDRGVAELEQLATAFWVTRQSTSAPVEERAGLLHELKPHVGLPEAERALREIDQMAAEAPMVDE